MNGLAEQPVPSSGAIAYPFQSYDGRVTFTREQWGQRTFELNTDGVANYGMYADWLHELQVLGGRPMMADMFQGAEAYLQTWERADGVPATSCRPAHERFTSRGLGRTIRLGDNSQAALYRAGQPLSRPGRSYRYCVTGRASSRDAVIAVFNAGGRIATIASTAHGDRAGAIAPGSSARRLSRRAHRVTAGVWAGAKLRGGARYVYGVRAGRVRFVAVTTAAELRRPARLSADLTVAGLQIKAESQRCRRLSGRVSYAAGSGSSVNETELMQ